MGTLQESIQMSEHLVAGAWVVGGVSRMLDVWSPSPLVLMAPPFFYPRHRLVFTLQDDASRPASLPRRTRTRRWLQAMGRRRRCDVRLQDSCIYFDARHDSSDNVAHVLQGQTAVALAGLDALGLSERHADLVFVVREDTPAYSLRLFEALGFRTLSTFDVVAGVRLKMEPVGFPLHAMAGRFLRAHALKTGILTCPGKQGERVFVSRRHRRTLSNLEEVEPRLAKAGYRTVYLEDLPVEEQIRCIATATDLFGLHGAGLGFMLFRDPHVHGTVVECFSCGFATNWARAISSMTGDTWIGGQGALDPRVLRDMAAGARSHRHEARSYRLDTETITVLLRLVDAANHIGRPSDATQLQDALDVIRPSIPGAL